MAEITVGNLSFDEQIRFFRGKVNVPTRRWADLWRDAHDRGFMVAGAAKADLLSDFRRAVDRAISDGTTLRDFQKDFDQIVARHGWQYRGSRGWRTRVIYETNLRTSYAAGRFQQLQQVKQARPYWRYVHSDAVRFPRPLHVSWDGLVLDADDPWWQTHYPPNGWGCKCKVFALSDRDLERFGKSGPDPAPDNGTQEFVDKVTGEVHRVPTGIDPGWDYAPGRSVVEQLAPRQLDNLSTPITEQAFAATALPAPRRVSADIRMAPDLAPTAYVDAFLSEFGAARGRHAFYEDVTGARLLISDAMFRDREGRLKVTKGGRERDVLMLAETIKSPDEIWMTWVDIGDGVAALRRRYLARFDIVGSETPALAVFELGKLGWTGVTAFTPRSVSHLERQRAGKLVYRRE